ncbi:hypothetical protein HMH01_06285 [Halovulum dunhuangense]|uniref:LPS sulfotransferase NodH n=1 Tax=Halovulum dunhuangense TaxID=1505036 RepID=A0A849L1A5_9RHOB|nr:sulfotransferase [Halovulum dunhuangense]NNU80044.1 hypothetical protein [Halovulum dunhuangense]
MQADAAARDGQPVLFAVMAMPRTGSSLLNGMFRAHPDAYVHGELFNPRGIENHIREEFRAQADMRLRETDPIAFVRAAFAFAPNGERVRGFKHFHSQSVPVSDWLLASGEVRKIILDRENRLAMYASSRLAKDTGVWNMGAHAPERRLAALRQTRTGFNPQAFRRFVARMDAIYARYAAAKGPVTRITYAQAALGETAAVHEFLGLEPLDLPPPKAKLHGSDIIGRFHEADRPAIEAVLSDMGREDWATEPV